MEKICNGTNLENWVMKGVVALSNKIGTKNLVLFSFMHFSEKISIPKIVERVIWEITERLKSDGYTVNKTPYRWENIFSNFCAPNKCIPEAPSLKWSK